MTARGQYDDPNDPLFIFTDGSPVLPSQVRYVLRSCLCSLNLDAMLYDTHSFRIGMATDMLKNHYTISEIRQKGRWQSNVVYKYLRSI